MKHLIFTAALMMVVISCKKSEAEKEDSVVDNVPDTVATPVPDSVALADTTDRHSVETLWARSKLVDCNRDTYLSSEYWHEIQSESEFLDYARRHAENQGPGGIRFYDKTWKELDDFFKAEGIECYNWHLGLVFEKGNLVFRKVNYADDGTCYSEPLFRGIELDNAPLGYPVSLHFTKGMVPDRRTADPNDDRFSIIFKVRFSKGGERYYDMSDNPADPKMKFADTAK